MLGSLGKHRAAGQQRLSPSRWCEGICAPARPAVATCRPCLLTSPAPLHPHPHLCIPTLAGPGPHRQLPGCRCHGAER